MRHLHRGTTVQEQRVKALLSRLAAGDQTAFTALYEQVAGQVYGLVNEILRCPCKSEEVAAEALLEIWRAAPRYDPSRGSGCAWIMTMAHRRAVDRVRSEQSARDHQATGAKVRTALDQLTDLQREAVQLAYYRGYTYPEVAELLDAPLSTVASRMRDGLIRLRDALGPGLVTASS